MKLATTELPRSSAAPPRPVYRFFAILVGVPVAASIAYLYFVLMPSGRGGSGPDVGADLRGVVPVFVAMILGPVGIGLSIAASCRHERYALAVLGFYALLTIAFFFH